MTSKEALNKMSNYIGRLGGGETLEEEDIILYDLELLDWLIEKMYVAGGLIELKVCPPNNPTIPKYHNAIETHDKRFNDFINRINELKYKR